MAESEQGPASCPVQSNIFQQSTAVVIRGCFRKRYKNWTELPWNSLLNIKQRLP